ncbi:DUF2242 domain-containing protein [Ideonella alba]|uniref:DUF2242 domain-containing protein n=1 Tax=Ideonella alba TaxID=2824118 RepID=A0A940YH56_9BURK|nr:DUF2242 domain-containing protein [Ideonella alba]MBQ0933266.1 DUF2242 domain-containing protein [Ideonella alba]
MRLTPLIALLMLATLAGCATRETKKVSVYQREGFETTETYSRLFDAPVAVTCEAARRALLSQGYLIGSQRADSVAGSKSFQPDGEVHMQITFNIACLPEGRSGRIATAFVSAIQDRYALKKSSNSASLGVGALGSLSIPVASTDDSLVKVASETIPAGPFYDRFFALMQRYLEDASEDAAAAPLIEPPPMAAPARPASAPTAAPTATPAAAASTPASAAS